MLPCLCFTSWELTLVKGGLQQGSHRYSKCDWVYIWCVEKLLSCPRLNWKTLLYNSKMGLPNCCGMLRVSQHCSAHSVSHWDSLWAEGLRFRPWARFWTLLFCTSGLIWKVAWQEMEQRARKRGKTFSKGPRAGTQTRDGCVKELKPLSMGLLLSTQETHF